MNFHRIDAAVARLKKNTKALAWLEEYGSKIDGKEVDAASFKLTLGFAGSCDGSAEAASMLEAYARLSFADLVKQAVANCHNTMNMDRAALIEEAGE